MAEVDLAQGSVAESPSGGLLQPVDSNLWFDALHNDTPTFVLIADRDGRLLSAN